MGRKLLTFLLSELAIVRVLCKNPKCGAVVELPVGRLKSKYEYGQCPLCREEIVPQFASGKNPLTALAEAIDQLQQGGAKLDLEFVLPDPSE